MRFVRVGTAATVLTAVVVAFPEEQAKCKYETTAERVPAFHHSTASPAMAALPSAVLALAIALAASTAFFVAAWVRTAL